MWTDDSKFDGFGPNALNPLGPSPLHSISGVERAELRQNVRQSIPSVPGVYGMLDHQQRLIYVGKSKSLRSRLLSYFNPAVAQEKAGRIIETARQIVWETQPSEFAALLREQQLIRRWVPRWNVQEVPKRQRPVYLCLGRGPAATFFLSRVPPQDGVVFAGPFLGAGRMSRAVDALNTYFRLRDCKNSQGFHFSEQLTLFEIERRAGCLRLEIGSCSGPCAGVVSLQQYNQQIVLAKKFLDGHCDAPLQELKKTMARAAEDWNFEFAAKTRDDLRCLEYLHRKLCWLDQARNRFHFIYAPACHPTLIANKEAKPLWYFIRSGEVCDVMIAPQTPSDYAQMRKQLRQWHDQADDVTGHGPYPHTLFLVASWFKKHQIELCQTFQPDEAGRKYRNIHRVEVVTTE